MRFVHQQRVKRETLQCEEKHRGRHDQKESQKEIASLGGKTRETGRKIKVTG